MQFDFILNTKYLNIFWSGELKYYYEHVVFWWLITFSKKKSAVYIEK